MIVVFGSLNVDFVMRVERLPQAGETVLGGRYLLVQGGKGANQACAAARASMAASGAASGPASSAETPVAMVGQVGRDDWGAFALVLLEAAGVDLSRLGRGEALTGCATICVDARGRNAIAVASGANLEARAERVPDDWLRPESWLILQMEVPFAENWALVGRARERGARVLLNVAPAAPVPAEVLDRIDVLVVNEIEARMLAEMSGAAASTAGSDPGAAARRLAADHDLLCVTTLGGEGALAFGRGGAWAVGTLPVAPVDTTGAGDAFVGCLAVALGSGAPVPEALRFASAGAGLSCLVAGAQSSFASRAEIEARLDEVPPARGL